MQCYPAIDILDGYCVRLEQGDYNIKTIYGDDPVQMALKWQSQGATFIHCVDLNGAREGKTVNYPVIQEMAKTLSIPIQVGGGIRTIEDIDAILKLGVYRVILGTVAIENPSLVKEAIERFGSEKIVVGIDAKNGQVATHGWEVVSSKDAYDVALEMKVLGVKTIVYTDIAQDGMMRGPNILSTQKMVEKSGINIIISGGVSGIADILKAKKIGCEGAILGKALYIRALKLEEAIMASNDNNKRIIPCLDLKDGRVVKGIKFVNCVDAGDPVEAAIAYQNAGADELVLLDISATNEKRDIMIDLVANIAKNITIPVTIGGGIRTVEDAQRVLSSGATRFSIGTAAFLNPELINECSAKFGKELVVIGIDAAYNKETKQYDVLLEGGTKSSGVDVVVWAKEVERRGAGQILLTSMDADGTKDGFDIELTRAVSCAVSIPVIASGGAGKKEDFKEALTVGCADAALAASLFHFKEIEIMDLKHYLNDNDIKVKL